MFGGDDDDDFMPTNNSKLASLFSSKSIGEGNTSLTYTAPKQPKRGGIVKNESRSSTKTQPVTGSSNISNATQAASNKLGIIIVKAVNTYKLEDGNYNLQGKLGAAVLGNASVCVYQLLLYKGKQHHITTTKITPKFHFTVQENNYGTFYDDQKQNWSIHFDEKEDAEEFAREIGLARGNSQGGNGGIQNLLFQDLSTGEGPGANVGDSMEIFYSVRVFADSKLGQLVESNLQGEKPQRVKIRKNVWEEGLIGAAKDSKRIILLPPSLLGPWKQEVSPEASLVVEVIVSRLKQTKSSREGTPSIVSSLVDSSESAVDSSTDETSIKARGASISEALTASPKTHKANIISRMARMGQATLPLKGAVTCDPSDSEDSEDEGIKSTKPPIIFKPSPKVRSARTSSTAAQPPSPPENHPIGPANATMPPQQMAVYQPLSGWQQQQLPQAYTMGQYGISQLDGQLYPMVPNQKISSHQLMSTTPTPAIGTPLGIPSADSHLSVFLSETRTHNTEVRIGLAKVADKVDQVLSKLDSANCMRPSVSNAILDSASLLASIQRLVSENEQLKTELTDKANKIDLQNDRIYQLLNSNHKYLEQSNSSNNDQRNHEALVIGLQQEKTQLVKELSESREKVQTMLAQLEGFKKETSVSCETMAAQLANQLEELATSKSSIEERDMCLKVLTDKLKAASDSEDSHEKTIATLKKSILETQESNDNLKVGLSEMTNQLKLQKLAADEEMRTLNAKYSAKIEAMEVELQEAKLTNNMNLEPKPTEPFSNKVFIDEVKKVMNVVYKSLHREFTTGETYLGEIIKETLASTIRDITCQLMERETFSTPVQLSYSTARASRHEKTHSTTGIKEIAEENSAAPSAPNSDPVEVSSFSKGFGALSVASSEPLSRSIDTLPSVPDATPVDTSSSTSGTNQIREMLAFPSETHFNRVDNNNPTADGPKDVGNSPSSDMMTNYAGGNAGDILSVPLAKLQGETDLSVKLLGAERETVPKPDNNLRVTSDPCVVVVTIPTPRARDDNRHEATPMVVQDMVTRPSTNTMKVADDGRQLPTNQEEETTERNLRESSLERKPWRSEPPPLFDDDEDEDDWLS